MLSSLWDLLPTVAAEEKASEEPEDAEGGEVAEEEAPAEEEEEEEPEDTAPGIREACGETSACAPAKHHMEHCFERVAKGDVHLPGENCVEEFFHFAHCVDSCAAPKIFADLK